MMAARAACSEPRFAAAAFVPIYAPERPDPMNIHDKNFAPSEAVIRYLDGDYVVVRPGSFVRCAITGKPIAVDDLKYWNVDRQEPYVDADAALEAIRRHGIASK